MFEAEPKLKAKKQTPPQVPPRRPFPRDGRRYARGAVEIPLVTFLGTFSVVAMAFVGFVFTTTSNLGGDIKEVVEVNVVQGERISAVEVRTERIPYLEAKIDALLQRQGIDPLKIYPGELIKNSGQGTTSLSE